jgi:hypothetical protein
MIEVYKDTKIFVACPANLATGGIEDLHQLAYHLRKDLGIDAYMYYYDFNDRAFDSPVHPGYKVYGNPYVTKLNEVEDDKRNIIIVPEIQEGISLLQHFKNIRKGVWFLSVDNYYLSRFITRRFGLFVILINKISGFLIKRPLLDANITSKKFLGKLVNKFKSRVLIDNKFKLMNKYDYKKDPILKLLDFYMFQSHYAFEHFEELNPKYYLSDYINEDFLKIQTDLSKKENMVVYNPKKGFAFTEKIIKRAKDIQFVPLINMTRDEVIKTLQKAKVYIDFGNHPGRDKIPRETVILGCCVIINKRGSAAFYEDVPIPDEYKFEDRDENIPKIVDKIRDCFDNYEERYKDFEHYREFIRNEPQRFIEDLKKIFVKIEQ